MSGYHKMDTNNDSFEDQAKKIESSLEVLKKECKRPDARVSGF